MMGFAFVAAIGLALGVIIARRWRRTRRRRAALAQPGRSPEHAISFARFDEIDFEVGRARCPCGGPVIKMSEGSIQTSGHSVRVVHTECAVCEEEVALFFRQEELLH